MHDVIAQQAIGELPCQLLAIQEAGDLRRALDRGQQPLEPCLLLLMHALGAKVHRQQQKGDAQQAHDQQNDGRGAQRQAGV